MEKAYLICREHMRAPVVKTKDETTLQYDFVADPSDTWITFTSDLIANAKYQLDLDELGRVIFTPDQDMASLQPVWTYTDDNSSILLPELSMKHDLYGIPNVVEVVYSNSGEYRYSRVVNDDPNSPVSTVSRGREIIHRETNPSSLGVPRQTELDDYAKKLLRDKSSVEYTITYSHGYCPVRVGDCVRLNYARAGLTNIKAKVTSQSIKCSTGCQVSETAVFTTKLWG